MLHNGLKVTVRRLPAFLSGASVLALTVSLCTQAQAQVQTVAANDTEVVTVLGRTAPTQQPGGGLLDVETAPRAVQSVTSDFISKQAPTTNVEQLMNMLPSATVTQADPYGLQTGNVYVRGLSSQQISFILEGTPLNDIGAASFYAHEQVEAEDLEEVSLQPGSVNIASPTINATGGQVFMKMRDPEKEFGGLVDFSKGSDNMDREFIRLNTGDIMDSGVYGMAAYSHTFSNNWVGPGGVQKHHIDAKLKTEWDDGSTLAAVVSWNWEVATFYRNPSLAQFNTFGNHFTYDETYTPNDTAYYRLNVNPYKNLTISIPAHIVANSRWSFDNTPYLWYGEGSGNFGSTMTVGSTYVGNQQVTLDPPPPGQPTTPGATTLVEQISHNYQLRGGNVFQANFALSADNLLTAGWWLQISDQHNNTRIGLANQATGAPLNYWGQNSYFTYNGGHPYDTPSYTNKTAVNMLFLSDTGSYFDDKLKVEAGFKYAWVNTTIDSKVPGANPHQVLLTQKLLPQLGVSWEFDSENQAYFTVSTNFRTPLSSSLLNQYNRNTGVQTSASGPTKPEFSVAEELGWRYNGDFIVASLSGFHYYFTNRQLTLSQQFGSQALTQSINAGDQETWGVDGQIATRPIFFHLRPYATFEYLSAKIESDLPTTSRLNNVVQADYLPTKGKTQIASPKFQAGAGLDYDDGDFFIAGEVKYVDSQYSTFMNDEKIPGYATSNINLGYRLPPMGFAKAPQIQLNLTNIGDTSALTGVSGFQTNAKPTVGLLGGTVSAGTPTYYLMPHFTAMVTVSTAF